MLKLLRACEDFMEFIRYEQWKDTVTNVVADYDRGERHCYLGTQNFHDLALAIEETKELCQRYLKS